MPLHEAVKSAPIKENTFVPSPVATTDNKPPSEFYLDLDDDRESKVKLLSMRKK